MIKTIVGSLAGVVFGAVIGGVVAFCFDPEPEKPTGWVSYPTIAEVTMPASSARLVEEKHAMLPAHVWILLGAGGGVFVGMLAAGTLAIIQTMKQREAGLEQE
jgi:hypothetical protein